MNRIPLETLVAPAMHLFLSPHYDDVALSCGGTAALLSHHGRQPTAVVIFGGEPSSPRALTDFARFQHERWGFADETAVGSRQAEEAEAGAILGLTIEVLSFLDAIYRGDRYLDDDQLFGTPRADEAGMPAEIVAALHLDRLDRADTRVYAPLAAGGHVDHRHVFLAGSNLARAGWSVWFYEDLPYALDEAVVEARIAGRPFHEVGVVDVEETWLAKIAAVMAYGSQAPVIFRDVAPGGGAAEVEAALATGATGRGDGRLSERFWALADVEGHASTIPTNSSPKGIDNPSADC